MKTVFQELEMALLWFYVCFYDAGIGLFMILGPTMVMSYWYCEQLMNHGSVIRVRRTFYVKDAASLLIKFSSVSDILQSKMLVDLIFGRGLDLGGGVEGG